MVLVATLVLSLVLIIIVVHSVHEMFVTVAFRQHPFSDVGIFAYSCQLWGVYTMKQT